MVLKSLLSFAVIILCGIKLDYITFFSTGIDVRVRCRINKYDCRGIIKYLEQLQDNLYISPREV